MPGSGTSGSGELWDEIAAGARAARATQGLDAVAVAEAAEAELVAAITSVVDLSDAELEREIARARDFLVGRLREERKRAAEGQRISPWRMLRPDFNRSIQRNRYDLLCIERERRRDRDRVTLPTPIATSGIGHSGIVGESGPFSRGTDSLRDDTGVMPSGPRSEEVPRMDVQVEQQPPHPGGG